MNCVLLHVIIICEFRLWHQDNSSPTSHYIFQETSTFVQVYTAPMPNSGEHVVSLKNDQLEPLAAAARKVAEAIQEVSVFEYLPVYCSDFRLSIV